MLGHIWLAGSIANLAVQPVRAIRDLGDTDFVYAFMTAARMLHAGTTTLYSTAAQRAARAQFIQLVPTEVSDRYINPPLAAWLIQPIAMLPPETALPVFLALSAAASLAAAAVLVRTFLTEHPAEIAVRTGVVCLATLPGAQAFAVVNWNALLLLPLSGALWASLRDRPILSGLLLSVLLVKPQTVWLVPVAMLFGRSWRPLAGFATGAVVWVATTLVLTDPGQLSAWATEGLPHHAAEARQTVGMPGIVASALGGGAAFAATAVLAVVAIAMAWRMRRALAAHPTAALALAVLGSALFAPHIWPEDMLLAGAALVVWAASDLRAALVTAAALDIAYLLDSALPQTLAHTQAIVLAVATLALARALVSDRIRLREQAPLQALSESLEGAT